MDLPNLFTQATQKGYSKKILTLILTDTAVQAVLLEVGAEESRILEESSLERYSDAATCVIKTDEVLQQLGPESENVSEVLFCVQHSWLEASSIVPEKKPLLQKLITDLSLTPLGFLVQTEVLCDYLIAGNAHISSVVVLIDENHVSLAILGKGLVQSVHTVGRSGNVSADIQEALARFLQEAGDAYLPAKVICASFVLQEEQLHEVQQALLGSDWEGQLPFVQKPTIDSINPSFFLKVIAQQAGKAVFGTKGPRSTQTEAAPKSFGVALPSRHPRAAEEPETAVDAEVAAPTLRNASGFTQIKKAPEDSEEVEETDVAVRQAKQKKFILLGFLAGVIALLVAALLWIFALSPVIITVIPEQKTLAKDISLTLDPQATEPDVVGLRIPGKKVTQELKKTSSTQTTGIKIVGESAKGTVTIVNKTTAEKTFPAGTQLSSDSLKFVLDSEVVVPAAVEKDSSLEYGQVSGGVTAVLIGAEGNIAKDTKFVVASFDTSSYAATSTADFTGGTSREVKVVSQADKDLLLAEIKKDVLAEANKAFTAQSAAGSHTIPAKDVLFTKTVFSHEKDAPTDELAVEVDATVHTLSYTGDALVPVARAVLADQLPAGFVLSDAAPQILSAPKAAGSEKASAATVTIAANLTSVAHAELDTQALKQKIAGKPIASLVELLKPDHVAAVRVQFVPNNLAGLIRTVPSRSARVTVQVGTAE